MYVLNRTPFQVAPLPGRLNFPGHSVTLIAKGRFKLVPGGVCEPIAEQPFHAGDTYYPDDDEAAGSLRCPTDFVYYKPRADLMLVGHCYPPDGKPAPACKVGFQVGSHARVLAVFGNRHWTARQPEAFTEMELRWENSFGGNGYRPNPVGKGNGPQRLPGGEARPLPNIEDPGQLVAAEQNRPVPAGFGPIRQDWSPRKDRLGSYGGRWLRERWPWFPDDFDWSHFNAAPQEMQLEGYLRGDEELRFVNLDRDLADYRSRLPGLRMRCFVEQESTRLGEHFREVKTVLDTLWVDMDAGELTLTWRGATPCASAEFDELRFLFMFAEPLDEQALDLEGARALFMETHKAWEAEYEPPVEELPGAPAAEPDEPEAADEATEVLVDPAVAELASLRERLKVQGIDPDAAVTSSAEEDRQLAELQAKALACLPPEAQASAVGAAPEPADAVAPDIQPLTREDVFARVRSGEPLAGCDLSGLDLQGLVAPGVDFSDCKFLDCDLSAAKLPQARLRGAVLAGALLQRAQLTECDLSDADLSGARCSATLFRKACLDHVIAVGLQAEAADFSEVSAAAGDFGQAALAGSLWDHAEAVAADFSGADLSGAQMHAADLTDATLDGVHAAKIDLSEAKLEKARCSEKADFTGARLYNIKARDSIWETSRLDQADLRYADLRSAMMEKASLVSADLSAVDLREGRLAGADLRQAKLIQMNFFMGSLENADLRQADLSGSNFYGAEFLGANTEGMHGSQLNLRMTKLDKA